MDAAGLRTLDMTNNDLAKDHLRHLVSNPLVCFVSNGVEFSLMKGLVTTSGFE